MKPNQAFRYANTEIFEDLIGPTTKANYDLRTYTYGVLVPDENHPLSCVSVSNNSLSIDLWIGCPFQCSYCHVQGTRQDIPGGKMPLRLKRRGDFTIDEILDALEDHPFFIKHHTIISIGTASTEPFAAPAVESTFDIMNKMVLRGWENPIWIVTKAGVPRGRLEAMRRIVDNVRGLMLSLCWAGNPKEIEPVQNDRFHNIEDAYEAGATISWYMRPLVTEWGANKENLKNMIEYVASNYGEYIDMIVPGGLRWTEGIEYGLKEVNNLPMPNIPKEDNIKELSDDTWEYIRSMCEEYFSLTPIYKKSSCSLSYMLCLQNIALTQYCDVQDCEASLCPKSQRNSCMKFSLKKSWSMESVQLMLDNLGIPANVKEIGEKSIITEPSMDTFTYAIRRTVRKRLSLGPKQTIGF